VDRFWGITFHIADIQKVVAISVMAAISDPAIHGVGLLVNQFMEYCHESNLLAII
jgi:hypothetical protein